MKIRGRKRDEMSAEALKRREEARRKRILMQEAKELGMTYDEYVKFMGLR